MIAQLRDDLAQEREASRESRARQHQRTDEVIDRLGRIDSTIAVAGQVDAQVRTELDDLKKVVGNIKPTVEEWRRMRTLGIGIVGLMTTDGLVTGATLQPLFAQLLTAVRHFLHSQP